MILPTATPILEFINNTNRTFVIPVYQRNYSWKAEHCEKLFDDLIDSLKTGKRHYFGNVVYYSSFVNNATGYSELTLIDGQQRVTTVMLLLAVIRDVYNDNDITDTYLINSRGNEKNRIKLKQIESDRVIYDAIINGNFDEKSDSNIGRNYKLFKKLIKDSKVEKDALLGAIRNLEIVALDLKINEDKERSESPQVIFESINATGKKLSTADLIRNYLLMGIDDDEQERYYKDYWLTIENSVGNDNISDFINKYLILKLGDAVNKDTEYKTFKKYLNKEKMDEVEALKDLAKYSKYYTWIQQPKMAEDFDRNASGLAKRVTISERLTDLKELGATSMTPLVMFLLEKADDEASSFDKNALSNALFALESWVFRTRVSGYLTSGALTTIGSITLPNILKRSDSTDYNKQIINILSNYKTQEIWPNDNDFMESFKKYNFYKTYKNYVQRKLEQFRSNEAHNWKPNSIEHIMPETLSKEWKEKLGENYTEIHGEYLHTIGNLAPLNMTDNIKNSNALFGEKLPQYRIADWFLTREIQNDAGNCSDWGVPQIETRANTLADSAKEIWRGPDARTITIEAEVRKKDSVYRKIIPDGKACNTTFWLKWNSFKTRSGFIFDIDAKMRIEIINEKPHFIIMAGSQIFPYAEAGKTPNKKVEEIRENGWHDEVILEEDISIFTSPSGASDFATSYSTNGWTEWKTEDGETLDDIVAKDVKKSYEQIAEE